MITETKALEGIERITTSAWDALFRDAISQEIEMQRQVYEGNENICNVLTEEQQAAQRQGKPFVANQIVASERAAAKFRSGVGMRLQGAYAHYKAGNELECIRHILLALQTMTNALGWTKATRYLNEQNAILFEIHRKEEKAMETQETA